MTHRLRNRTGRERHRESQNTTRSGSRGRDLQPILPQAGRHSQKEVLESAFGTSTSVLFARTRRRAASWRLAGRRDAATKQRAVGERAIRQELCMRLQSTIPAPAMSSSVVACLHCADSTLALARSCHYLRTFDRCRVPPNPAQRATAA